ncbi:MAG: ATP-binding cassette domain-containing protein [Chitinophagales bacterium]|nr:ATP-binding cassette domain-containing protein [Chitinophagales bacterium]
MIESVLSLRGVVKSYDKKLAVDNVSFEVPKGSIFGLLGPNGAGKTSIIRIITGITRADTGEIFMDGVPLNNRHPELIGYMPEERGLYKKMKVGEHLLYLARLKGLSAKQAKERILHWMEKFEISNWWNKKVEELSKGMQQKIQFIATIIHAPPLLILDEPFSGLDPVNTNLIKDEIYQLKEQGTSIIFSTHRMEQVEEICEHIVLINGGQNVLEGRVNDIKEQFKEHYFKIDYTGTLAEGIGDHFNIIQSEDKSIMLKAIEGQSSSELLRSLLNYGLEINAFHEVLPTLNQIFIRQVKQ